MQYIFIHGLGQSVSSWDDTIGYLTEREHVICPEVSSFIEGEEVTYKNLYQNFARYLNSLHEPINLCGLSLGAVMALNYAIDYPTKVQSLTLIAGQYKMPKTLLKLQSMIFRLIPERAFGDIGMGKKDFIELTGSMVELDFGSHLQGIACPVLIVCGEKDPANKKAARELAEYINGAQLQFIKDAKHEVNTDTPQVLAEILNHFYN
ncbi:alpha/beta fold hydrolase [Niameybacter massiliensis]|uniref:alpha/beta fold hydrolase n=1 Tax=Niameybacter massiliensis TaxID=1658108 RepID=UPI0006B4281F|nr:alpha/beta hydrolase [Niameybacter massiliensis]